MSFRTGGVKVKRILILMALLLVWTGSANGGTLKVMVPIDEFERMDERLEVLEKENSVLKADMNAFGDAEALNQQNKEMGARLNALEGENSKLQNEVESLRGTDQGTAQKKMESQISSLERKNARLKKDVRKLKDDGVLYASDRKTAREIYSSAINASTTHVFK
jgi:predicted RNase H-like nuclease (RuvC/YqgF family)